MKFFIDTANLEEIKAALTRGFIRGVTTNPSLLAKEPKGKFEDHIAKIVDILKKYQNGAHLSVEVFSRDPQEILSQAKHFQKIFNYRSLSIKVQVGWNELAVINKLAKNGISVNCTACMTVSQAVMAAYAGARYVSLFWGRIRDGGSDANRVTDREALFRARALDVDDFNPYIVVEKTRKIIDREKLPAEIIAGSIRGVVDIRDAGLAGAHIVTVPPKFFPTMISHFKTDEVVNQFLSDFQSWLK